MAKRKAKKRSSGPPIAQTRLSQCMIVKNEEKNIEQALSWGKGIVCEQIVVDTGSTDKTVEIAEKLGARVYHFEWIDDFSAAKNYAIEQATGNWIAFLDADEYFSKEDAKTLLTTLKRIRNDEDLRDTCLGLNMPLLNLDDDGKVSSVYDQERVFRNVPEARYKGKIHEQIGLPPESIKYFDEIKIIHTGYAQSIYEGSGKLGRNIEMIESELKERPDDLNLKSYLADALKAKGDEENIKKSEELYYEVINAPVEAAFQPHRIKAFKVLIGNRANDNNTLEEAEELCRRAMVEFPYDVDFEYYFGSIYNKKREYTTALDILHSCEKRVLNAKNIDEASLLITHPATLFQQLAEANLGLNDTLEFVKYATMALSLNKTEAATLGPYLVGLTRNKTSDDDIIELLSKVYDLKDPRDLLFIAKTAKNYGIINLARTIALMAQEV